MLSLKLPFSWRQYRKSIVHIRTQAIAAFFDALTILFFSLIVFFLWYTYFMSCTSIQGTPVVKRSRTFCSQKNSCDVWWHRKLLYLPFPQSIRSSKRYFKKSGNHGELQSESRCWGCIERQIIPPQSDTMLGVIYLV